MKYHFKIRREKKGFSARCLELNGCITQGDSWKHLVEMMQDAVSGYLDEPDDSTHIFPLPDPKMKGRSVVEVPVDPRIAFAMLVRQSRLQNKLTQKQAAQKLGMKHIYQYQKLESGKTANPELGTLVRLKALFPNLSVDAALA